MRVEPQGPKECMLASIGALVGAPLAEVRACAMFHANRNKKWYQNAIIWEDVCSFPALYWGCIASVCYSFDLDPSVCLPNIAASRRNYLPNIGKGLISITYTKKPMFGVAKEIGHVAPYENGQIWDPDFVAVRGYSPETLEQFTSKYKDSKLLFITIMEPKQ